MDIIEAGPKLHKELSEKFPDIYYSCGLDGLDGTFIYVFLRNDCEEVRKYLSDDQYEGHAIQWRIFKYNSGTEYDKDGYIQCENERGMEQPKIKKKKTKVKKKKPKGNDDVVNIEFID